MQSSRLYICAILAVVCAAAPLSAYAAATTTQSLTLSSLLGTSTPIEPSGILVRRIAQYSSTTADIARPVFGGIDAARAWLAEFLQGQIVFSAAKLPSNDIFIPNKENGLSSANDFSWTRALDTAVGVLWTVYFYFLVISRFIVIKLVLWYPVALTLIALLVWKLIRRRRK